MSQKAGTNQRAPTIRDVAKAAGVSVATVSNVLRGRKHVAEARATRVRLAVEQLGYVVDVSASRLRSRVSSVAGVLVPDISNPFFAEFVGAVEAAARQDAMELIVATSADDVDQEARRLRALTSWKPAGVIVIPVDEHFAAREIAERAGIPLVIADREPNEPTFDLVLVDNVEAAKAAAQHLLAAGHRTLLVLASTLGLRNVRERCAGIEAALADPARGPAGGCKLEILEAGFALAEVEAALDARLASGPLPSAILALNNVATLGALAAIHARGLAIPRDISLAGFDDYSWMAVTEPPITAVHQPVELMGEVAWGRLKARLEGDDSPPQRVELACRLEVRRSCLAPASRALAAAPDRGAARNARSMEAL